ncbi:pyrophosphatase [Thiospirillum jenense]|uniref:Pyrophosphatase n=1 Tax=Thiospirillum jenense TaxID=1653858 RepID=A0A839HDN9_9GAMM|nr:pyrophosphatase [Thiospirillum jenense]
MPADPDSYAEMLARVRGFHTKHQLRENGGEELHYRVALMAEELGEIAACVTKGQTQTALAEELADLLILLLGTAIATDIDLNAAFWDKMQVLDQRTARMINGRIRVSEFRTKK